MSWTNTCTSEFYQRYIRQRSELFSEETVEEAERNAIFRQSGLGEYAQA